jgi:hypothetical protein
VVFFKIRPWNLPGGAKENHEEPEDSRSPGRDFNSGPPEYEAGSSSSRPQRSLKSLTASHTVNTFPCKGH